MHLNSPLIRGMSAAEILNSPQIDFLSPRFKDQLRSKIEQLKNEWNIVREDNLILDETTGELVFIDPF